MCSFKIKIFKFSVRIFSAPVSPDQFWGGDPVWAGYSRRPSCGLDSRKHLLGGEQSGPDWGGQTGWDHENDPASRRSGASPGHRPRSSRWVRTIYGWIPNLDIYLMDIFILLFLSLTSSHAMMLYTSVKSLLTLIIFCHQHPVLDWLGCKSAQNWGSIHERWRQTHHPQGDRQWWVAQRTHCGLHGKTHCLDWCQVASATRF